MGFTELSLTLFISYRKRRGKGILQPKSNKDLRLDFSLLKINLPPCPSKSLRIGVRSFPAIAAFLSKCSAAILTALSVEPLQWREINEISQSARGKCLSVSSTIILTSFKMWLLDFLPQKPYK
jgi:hypothetical protein